MENLTWGYERMLIRDDALLTLPHPRGDPIVFVLLAPTFANPYHGDVLPGSAEAQSVTFQLRPKIEEADPRIPQSPYTHGLLAGLADGSVVVTAGHQRLGDGTPEGEQANSES